MEEQQREMAFFAKTFLQDSGNAINSSHNQTSTAVPAGLEIFKPALKKFSPTSQERPISHARIPAPASARAHALDGAPAVSTSAWNQTEPTSAFASAFTADPKNPKKHANFKTRQTIGFSGVSWGFLGYFRVFSGIFGSARTYLPEKNTILPDAASGHRRQYSNCTRPDSGEKTVHFWCNIGATLCLGVGPSEPIEAISSGIADARTTAFVFQRGGTQGASPQRAATEDQQSWRAKDPSEAKPRRCETSEMSSMNKKHPILVLQNTSKYSKVLQNTPTQPPPSVPHASCPFESIGGLKNCQIYFRPFFVVEDRAVSVSISHRLTQNPLAQILEKTGCIRNER
jgi:hypothetical protein